MLILFPTLVEPTQMGATVIGQLETTIVTIVGTLLHLRIKRRVTVLLHSNVAVFAEKERPVGIRVSVAPKFVIR